LVLTLLLAGGLVWVARQHKTVPYVVEVDSLGAALAIKLADPGGHPADERIVRSTCWPLSSGGAWHERRAHLQIRPGYKAAFLASSTGCSPRTQGTTARCTARRPTWGHS